eukprot:Nk52_evm155s226 gene=Nk52_evmTU155s226
MQNIVMNGGRKSAGRVLRLVTFDVNNTLLRVSKTPGCFYSDACGRFGIQVECEKSVNEAMKRVWKEKNELHPSFGYHKGLTAKQWWKDVVEQTLLNSGQVTAKELEPVKDALFESLYAEYANRDHWEFMPGAEKIVKDLSKSPGNYYLGIISNNDERLESLLQQFNVKDLFGFVLYSSCCGMAKPDTSIFDLALAMTNEHMRNIGQPEILPEQALHIGDNALCDYIAARKAGWEALLVQNNIGVGEEGRIDLNGYLKGWEKQVPLKDVIGSVEKLPGIIQSRYEEKGSLQKPVVCSGGNSPFERVGGRRRAADWEINRRHHIRVVCR